VLSPRTPPVLALRTQRSLPVSGILPLVDYRPFKPDVARQFDVPNLTVFHGFCRSHSRGSPGLGRVLSQDLNSFQLPLYVHFADQRSLRVCRVGERPNLTQGDRKLEGTPRSENAPEGHRRGYPGPAGHLAEIEVRIQEKLPTVPQAVHSVIG
jgi:hypothetical protein